MVRNGLVRFFTLFMTAWYMCCVVGFNIHTCLISNRSFLSFPYENVSCKTVHPDMDCHCSGNCANHAGTGNDGLSFSSFCCTNEVVALSLAGDSNVRDRNVTANAAFVCSAVLPPFLVSAGTGCPEVIFHRERIDEKVHFRQPLYLRNGILRI